MTNLPVLSFFQYNLISGKLYLIPLMEAGKKMKNVKILNHILFLQLFEQWLTLTSVYTVLI